MATDSDFRDREVLLRDVTEDDLPVFFEQQREPAANRMAAFPPRDRPTFMTHWTKILDQNDVVKKTILWGDEVAGNIVCFEQAGRRLVGYWLGKRFWGKGIATRALAAFVKQVRVRPLHALVFKGNVGSIRVLEKCGFRLCGESKAPAAIGGKTAEEFVFLLAE